MGEASRNLDNKSPFTYSVDLIDCLKTEIDSIDLKQCLEHFKLLESQSDADFKFFDSSVQGLVLAFPIFGFNLDYWFLLLFVKLMFSCFAKWMLSRV